MAQELWRVRALRGIEAPELLGCYELGKESLDFVIPESSTLIEVKAGTVNPQEFIWFTHNHADKKLVVVSKSQFKMRNVNGVTFEEFLGEAENTLGQPPIKDIAYKPPFPIFSHL